MNRFHLIAIAAFGLMVSTSASAQAPDQAALDVERSAALAAFLQAGIGVVGLIGLGFTVFYARKAWVAARETNVAQSRAWLSVICQLSKPERGTTQHGVNGIYFNVICPTKNHGRSPATSVSFHAEIALMGSNCPNMEARMTEYCDAIRKRADQEAEAIFPDAADQLSHMVFLPQPDIDAAIANADFKMISPIVYGCVNYKSPSTAGVKQTRFAYSVCTVGANGEARVLMPAEADWLQKPIVLVGPGKIVAD
ncbi:MAG: hypothetical protein GC155_04680 [Alphaproteobacteria bacterium]|nr:hypothetical protein [Alphaproteobacteria bacterium]